MYLQRRLCITALQSKARIAENYESEYINKHDFKEAPSKNEKLHV